MHSLLFKITFQVLLTPTAMKMINQSNQCISLNGNTPDTTDNSCIVFTLQYSVIQDSLLLHDQQMGKETETCVYCILTELEKIMIDQSTNFIMSFLIFQLGH